MAIENIESERIFIGGYKPADWRLRRRFCRFLIRHIGLNLLAKLDRVEGLENIPASGPAVLMMNHLSFADSILVLYVAPRDVVPLAKAEVYDYPMVGIFPKIWGVVPVRREEFDRRAVQGVMEVLRTGELVLVAPEGTRGKHLQQGKVGIAYMASRSGVPVVPVAIEGTPGFPTMRFFSDRWKGPGAHLKFGRPFRFRAEYQHAGREHLRKMTDEAMFVLASHLPKDLRGEYSDLSQATQETIEWL